MSALEAQQRGLLALMKGRATVDDPYLRLVAGSRDLAMARKIALWWSAYALSAQCRFTTRLLRRSGALDAAIADYFDNNATSPFVEELSRDFLTAIQARGDPLIRAVAAFERALLLVRTGSDTEYEIVWDRNPNCVILALEEDNEPPSPEPESRYRMRVSGAFPQLVACERETGSTAR